MDHTEIYLPEVLFEFVVQGNFVKVMAVDPRTRIEVAMVGDARTPKQTLENLATQKLKMAIQKKCEKRKPQANTDNLY